MRRITAPILVVAAWFPSAASAAPRAPEVVVDLDSGRVLHERESRQAWRPASLTKLMTTYVVLSEVASGRVRADLPVTITPSAAQAPPSRSGLPVGTRLLVGDALKVLMVKSANDVAAAIAQAVAGDEATFVAMMNRESARLGMSSSRWRNPHGLDAPGQETTARDLAVLATAIHRDFPSMAGLFSIGAISLRGAVMTNHNGAVGRYARSDGMKTGFTCASGFNVVSTAHLGSRRVVAVLLGRPNPMERDARATLLLEAALSSAPAERGVSLDALAGSDGQPAPRLSCGGRRTSGEDDAGEVGAALQEWVRAFSRMPRQLGQPVAIVPLPAAAPVTAVASAPQPRENLSNVVSAYAPAVPDAPVPREFAPAQPAPAPLRTHRF